MAKKLRRLLRIATLALLFAGTAMAQSTSSITGVVTDASTGKPVVGAETRTAMLPGLCSFFIIRMWALGICSQEKTSDMHGSMRRSMTSLLAWLAWARLAKCEPCTRF